MLFRQWMGWGPDGGVWHWAADLDRSTHRHVACGAPTRAGAAASIPSHLGCPNVTLAQGGAAARRSAGFPIGAA